MQNTALGELSHRFPEDTFFELETETKLQNNKLIKES